MKDKHIFETLRCKHILSVKGGHPTFKSIGGNYLAPEKVWMSCLGCLKL